MPPAFHMAAFPAKFWIPLVISRDNLFGSGRGSRWLTVFARLRPGVTVRRASSEMQAISQRLAQSHPATDNGWGARVLSLQKYSIQDSGSETALAFLMAAVGFVLLIACANLANLMLARNSARRREFSLRAVMGASRIRLARQLLTESVLLSLVGGSLGIAFALGGLRLILSQFNWNEDAVAMAREVVMNTHVLVFSIAASLLAALLFGLAPALQVSRRDFSGQLKEGGRGSTAGRERHRLQRLLVVGQLALSIFLLVGASFFVEGFLEEIAAAPGFNPHGVLTASVSLRGLKYLQPRQQRQFFESVLQRLRALPGVESAAVGTDLPFDFPGYTQFEVEGHPASNPSELPRCGYFAVSAGYFSTLQIPLLQGREFGASDTASSAPVAIINEAFARQYFAGINPIGRRVRIGSQSAGPPQWSEVVGLVGSLREFVGQARPRPELFVPFESNPSGLMRALIRTRTGPINFSDSIRNAVWAVDPDQAVTEIRTMDRVILDSSTGDDIMAELMGSFSGIALALAAIGIYGVLSYLVGLRTHEMGIRMALGANPRRVLSQVIGDGMSLVAVGVGIGFLASLTLPKLVAAGFEGFHFHSVLVLALAPPVVLLVGLLACCVPARRAMRVDPIAALRCE